MWSTRENVRIFWNEVEQFLDKDGTFLRGGWMFEAVAIVEDRGWRFNTHVRY